MPLFKKSEEPEAAPAAPPGGTPTEVVVQMRQQGYSNNQIIQSLTDQGYSSAQIFDAMSQADIGKIGASEPVPEQPMPQPEAQPNVPPMPGAQPIPQQEAPPPMPQQPVGEVPPVTGMPPPMGQPSANIPPPAPSITKEDVEEIAESIIEEKWTDLMKSVEKVIEWKELTESRIDKIEQAIKDLKGRFEELHKGVLERISHYDKGIRQVGVNVKAMEEVFKRLLPQFTENVSELSKITKKAKKP